MGHISPYNKEGGKTTLRIKERIMMNETQAARLAEMISWLAEHPAYRNILCGMECADVKDILSMMAALEERGYYEFLLMLLVENYLENSKVNRAMERYLAGKVGADLRQRGLADEIESLRRLLWEEVS